MAERLFQPHILDLYLAEYRAELAKAVEEYEGRRAGLEKRQIELTRDIHNLLSQIEAGASGYARSRINDRINELGARLEQIERQLIPPPTSAENDVSAGAIIGRLRALLDELGAAAAGGERAAASVISAAPAARSRFFHQPYDVHPHGPFAAVLAPSLIVRARGGYSPVLSLVLMESESDVDGAHGLVLDHPRHQPIQVRLADDGAAHLVLPQSVRFLIEGGPRVAGVGRIGADGRLEASSCLAKAISGRRRRRMSSQ